MTVLCAWCGKHLKGSEDGNDERISHGICKGCSDKLLQALNERNTVLVEAGA